MSDFEILTSKDSQKWKEYLSMLPIEQQDVYFTPEYYILYEANGDGSARCFVFKKDGDIALYPFLINKINDLGYDLDDEYYDIQGAYGYNGVVSSTYDTNFVDSFYEAFSNYVNKQHIVCEFVRFHPLLQNVGFSCKHLGVVFDRKTVLLNTMDTDVCNQFDKQVMKKVRRSIRDGISIREAICDEDFDSFIRVYKGTMDFLAADDFYYFSDTYFDKMRDLHGHSYKLLVALLDRQVVGGMWMMSGPVYAHNHLSAATVDLRSSGVNVAIQYEVILHAMELGKKYLHFGGGRTDNEDDSLLRFKQNFSKATRDFYTGKKIYNKIAYDQIVNLWLERHPQSAGKYGHMLQGYRKLDVDV